MKKLCISVAAAMIIGSVPVMSAEDLANPEMTASAQTVVAAKVNGMVCDFCARAVTKVFSKEEAVESVDVDLDNGEIHVTLKAGEDLADDTVETLVIKSGYTLVSIERAAT